MVGQKEPKLYFPKIQNEILKEISLSILRNVVESIKNDDFYSIMLDETSDLSNKEQTVFCIRWVDENIFSYEDFLGLHEMEKTDAVSIAKFINTF